MLPAPNLPPTQAQVAISGQEKQLGNIKRLIWLYFWLLLFEGALRKWVLPQLSAPLLIVRDPVLLAAYVLAWRAGVFPRNGWVIALAVIGFLSLLISVIPLWIYSLPRIALISGFGFRANFLHLPLIFLMPAVLTREDVKKIGWWTLLLAVPMTLLMIAQFQAGPDSILNRTASGEGEMITAGSGKVRTSGTFSFILGVVSYYAMALAFIVWAALKRGVYRNWLLVAATGALVIGIVVSGSRLLVAACALVIMSLVVVLILRPRAVNRLGQALIIAIVVGWVLAKIPVFKEGLEVLTARFFDVAEATDQSITVGMTSRVLEGFTNSFYIFGKAPFLGFGLGIGTNAAAQVLTGEATFLLSEEEWSRIFLESGPLFGLAYVVWRCGLALHVGFLCLRSVRVGNILPLLLFSTTVFPILNGQFGQSTVLGFTVFVTGLALSARNEAEEETISATPRGRDLATRRVVGRRSAYAERLHGPAAPRDQDNGSLDR